MKSILIASLVATSIFAHTCYAQSTETEYPWIKVSSNDSTTTYINIETIKDLGGGIKQAWGMSNYSSPQKIASREIFRSSKSQYKNDCLNETYAYISGVFYGQKNGAGDVVFSQSNKIYEIEWDAVVPGTVG